MEELDAEVSIGREKELADLGGIISARETNQNCMARRRV